MASAIIMPKLGNTVEECLVSTWKVSVGDTVKEGDIVCEVETDKTTGEVEATTSGVVLALFWEEGDLVPVFQNICVVGEAGESFAEFTPEGGEAAAEAPAAADEAPAPAAAPEAAPAAPVVAEVTASDAPLSPRAKKFLAEHPTNLAGIVGSGPDGRILEKDIADAYHNGARLSPAAAARQAAGEAAPASGSGVSGMVLGSDMGKAAPAPAPVVEAAPVASSAPAEDVVTEIKLPNIRKLIARNLMEGLHNQAQYTLDAEADVSGLLALRKKIKGAGETLGLGNINIGDMVMFAVIKALQKHPEMNAEFDGEVIRQHSAINMGFACDTPRGLMVPVLHSAQSMSLGDMSSTVKGMAKEAVGGTLSPDCLSGGTFTVSNLGAFGITTFTPVINPPQVAILGVGKTLLRPVRTADGIEYRDYMQLSLTMDHRVIDGAPGARFLQTLTAILENFELVCIAG